MILDKSFVQNFEQKVVESGTFFVVCEHIFCSLNILPHYGQATRNLNSTMLQN